jgi:hypothetical protein
MTINKSQGQTFPEIAIYLPAPVFFANGHSCTSPSPESETPARSPSWSPTNQPPGLHTTLNVIYTEIFEPVTLISPNRHQQILQI